MKNIQTSTIAAPGFLGLNSQESSIQLSSGFALKAQNCVIDKYGRIGARRGWDNVNTSVNTDLGAANAVKFMFELQDGGSGQFLSAGNNKLFVGTTTMTTKTVRNQANSGDASYTITDNNWQAASLPYGDGADATFHAYLVQSGHPPLVYHKLPTPGTGATFTVSTVSSGAITAVTVSAAGSGYNVGDVLTMSGGTGSGAKLTVATLSGTGVATVTITVAGTGYTVSDSLTSTVTTTAKPNSHAGSYGFQQLGDVGQLPNGYSTSDFKPNCSLAAYGRIWLADIVGDQQTVYFSRLLDGTDFAAGDSGSLSLNAVFPNNDQIVAIAAHNGFLIIFGRNNIAIYANPIDVTQLTLQEFIPNVGCIARDSVQSTGTDLLFLSDAGLRSLARVIQEKSLPFRDVSKNVRDELMASVASETAANIKSVYFDRDAFYLLSLPTSKVVYCFDMRSFLPDGASRVTTWTSLDPSSFLVTQAKELYIGKAGYIGKYYGHTDNGSAYRLIYYTNYFDFGAPTGLKVLKKVGFVVIGGSAAELAIKYGFDYKDNLNSVTKVLDSTVVYEYNIGEYNIAEFSNGLVIDQFQVNVGGSGIVIQLGLETDIEGDPISIQKIDVYVASGKTV